MFVILPVFFREPSFLYTFFLFEEFVDGPEAGECRNAGDCRPYKWVDEKWKDSEAYSYEQECPPAFFSYMIFCLYYDRVEDSYDYECRESYNYSF